MTEKSSENSKPKTTAKTTKSTAAKKQKSARAAKVSEAAIKSDKPSTDKPSQEAYLVLARKYRPHDFSDLIGQDAMVQTLRNAFKSNRIAQSYMLSGVRGVGKTTTARILARALNFETDKVNAPTIDMKQEGRHCSAIMAGTHVDIMEMDAASHTGIDDIREIIEAARYKPVSARFKVYIIDEVHMLSKSAFNGLLKTLEEPPAHVKFIFATTELRKVPVTVLSRCQRFDLRRIDIHALNQHFANIAAKENVKINNEAISLIARAAEGSVRDGLSMLDQAFARAGKTAIAASDIRSMLGLADKAEILILLKAMFKGDAEKSLNMFREFYEKGGDPQQIISDMADAVHSITRMKATGQENSADDQPEAAKQELASLSEALSMSLLHRAWQTLLQGYDEVSGAPNQLSAAEMVLLRLTFMSDLPSPADLINALKHTREQQSLSSNDPHNQMMSEQTSSNQDTTLQKTPFGRGETPETTANRAINGRAQQTAPDVFTQINQEEIEQGESKNHPIPHIRTFEDVIALIGMKRDVKLKLQVEEYAELVNFAPGRIELHLLEDADEGVAGELSKKLTNWTGNRWMVALSHERGQSTIASQRRKMEQQELVQIKSHPVVEAALKTFPGAEITAIKPIKPTPDNT